MNVDFADSFPNVLDEDLVRPAGKVNGQMKWTLTPIAYSIVQWLHRCGYGGISRRHGTVARIDNPEWIEALAFDHTGRFPGDKEEKRQAGLAWATGMGVISASRHYLATLSDDHISGVPEPIYHALISLPGVHDWREKQPYEWTPPPCTPRTRGLTL